ncbi:MAG: DNA polymerase I [bacterium]
MKKKFIIIDGNAIIHRAYHAIPPLTTKDGRIVNAVYGFTSMLLKVWKQLQPTHLAVTFDMPGPTFRHEKFEDYKATRVKADQELYDQIPWVHEVVETFNISIYEKSGYEADDVIGTVTDSIKDVETYIVTGDMDTLQLVNDDVKVYTLRKGMSDVVIYDEDKVKDRFGFGPDMVVDYKALRGDSSDNIPGITGIGEKTATELITKIGGLDKIYQALENRLEDLKDFKPGVLNKLKQGKEQAEMSKELAQIDCAVPGLEFNLEDCKLDGLDQNKILRLFQEYEFVSLLKRVPGMQDIKIEQPKKKKAKDFKFIDIKEAVEVEGLFKLIKKQKSFACKEVLDGQLKGLALVANGQGYWLEKKFLSKFKKIFEEKGIELIGHDLKQLVKSVGLIENQLFDIMIASYLLNPGTRAHDVASLVLKILGKELPVGTGQESLFGIDARTATHELFLITQIVEKLKKDLDKANNLGLLEKIEMPLVQVLAEIEMNGVAIDLKMLKKMSVQVQEENKKISKSIYQLAGQEFNISSTQQLREVLFEKLELPTQGIKKGKTGYSTDSEQLGKLQGAHPIIEKIELYRELTKLQNTYIDVLPALVDKKTGRIHAKFNQAITATGRLSSSEPNLQNIPIRTDLGREIRKAFVAEPGNSLVVADYSQIELRIVASLAKDKKMMEIFWQDLDIHQATASAINGVSLDKVTKEMRRAAKAVNFGILYGMGSYGLSWRVGMPVWQAKEFIERYFEQFKGVKEYMDQTLEFTKKQGYCETLFGRRRYIPELNSPNYQLRSSAERMAINHPVQGTAADLMKMAMIEVNKKVCGKDVKMILQVHDELVLEVKKGLEKETGKLLKQAMEEVVILNVPVKVEVNSGKRWGEIK